LASPTGFEPVSPA